MNHQNGYAGMRAEANGLVHVATPEQSQAQASQAAPSPPPPTWYLALYGVGFLLAAVCVFFGSAAAAGVWYRVARSVAGVP